MQWGSEEWKRERDLKLLNWFSGNKDAVDFLLAISDVAELWDDLIDGDKPITKQRVNTAFMTALVELPNNPFYVEHREHLTPIIIQAANSWLDANELEKGDVNQRALAYTLRNMDIQLVQAIVYITGGFAKLRTYSADIWDYFGARQDPVLDWVQEKKL
jgi:hypothetical protein